jgi:pyruvate kinase
MLPQTKIVCTIGPSSWAPEVLKQLVDNGMTVARINGAFADTAEMERVAGVVRSVSKNVALMIDIKGHEVRMNKFKFDLDLKIGDIVTFGSTDKDYIYIETYPELYKNLHSGDKCVSNDGNTVLEVTEIVGDKIMAKVLQGTKLQKGKSLNFPGIFLDNPPITSRDIEQIKFAVDDHWDFVAASFVRCKEDVEAVKEYIIGSHTKVISKVEDSFGIKNIDEIIAASEGIMVARGDLGVELPFYKVPHIQKEIIKKCNAAVKPVIVATQMLESMINNPFPTRAEVSDVANAVMDGTDAIMLSGESTSGKYPIECVTVMKEVSLETEEYLYAQKDFSEFPKVLCDIRNEGTETAIAMAQAVANLSYKLPTAKILVDTRTGFSARLITQYGLKQNIYALTPYDYYSRRLALSRGITAIKRTDENTVYKNMVELEEALVDQAKNHGFIKNGDTVILVIAASYSHLPAQNFHEKTSIKVISV